MSIHRNATPEHTDYHLRRRRLHHFRCWLLLPTTAVVAMVVATQCVAAETGSTDSPAAAKAHRPQPLFETRELYAVGHFGNSYEAMGDRECRDVLTEAKFWGYNGYLDWFDSDDCRNPFVGGHSYGLGEAHLDAKTRRYAMAQRMGLLCSTLVSPNHVYIDQCAPGVLATLGERVQGQLICPSIPAARATILKNWENLFAHLAKSGVQLEALHACPYDYGGCRCDKCKPWILTFSKLTHEIYEIARKYHPKVNMTMVGWWWTAEEHRLFADWVDQNAPGWVDIMYLHMPYNATKIALVPLPKGCKLGAFVHIGYSDTVGAARDIYGHFGPVVAAERIQKSVIDLKAQGVVAVNAYSEGVLDDVNKAILGGLSTGEYQTADEVLEAYARRYFGVDAETAKQWAKWLKAWGKSFDVNTQESAATLEMLLKKTPRGGWRLRQWELKQQLFAANREIGSGDPWTPERLAAVERFWDIQEQIRRGLWGLPPQRHIFARRFTPVPWYPSWAKVMATQAATIGKEQ